MGKRPRVRFSRADIEKELLRRKPVAHTAADRCASGGASRVSTHQAARRGEKRLDTTEQLMEMLSRSRRRTRFNHRSSEGGTTGERT